MKEKQFQPHWKLNQHEFLNYFSSYISFFNTLEIKFCEPLQDELIPLYLVIFGSHREPNFDLLIDLPDVLDLLKQDYGTFYHSIRRKSIIKNEQVLRGKCQKFATRFFQILNQFRLFDERYTDVANNWLARSLYTAICMGHPQLVMPPSMIFASFSEDLLNELWKDSSPEEWIKAEMIRFREIGADEADIERYKQKPFRPFVLPSAKSFQFVTYDIFLDMQQYEKMAMKAYREHIKAYLRDIQNNLKKYGWKRKKLEDYDRVHWLVLWNKFDFQYLWEIIQPIEQYCNVSVNIETVRKAFNKFKKLGLPVKPFGKGGKIITDKNTQNNSADKK